MKLSTFGPRPSVFIVPSSPPSNGRGDETWWYVSTGNRTPYPNNFIDYFGLDVRIRLWMAWRFGVQGSLYWETNYWNAGRCAGAGCQDPWSDAESYTGVGGGRFGNGDGRLLYPPEGFADGVERRQGPVASLRWELLRDGLEDYEYLWLLNHALQRLERRDGETELVARGRALLAVPHELVSSLASHTQDPLALSGRRGAVGNVLEEVLHATVRASGDERHGR